MKIRTHIIHDPAKIVGTVRKRLECGTCGAQHKIPKPKPNGRRPAITCACGEVFKLED